LIPPFTVTVQGFDQRDLRSLTFFRIGRFGVAMWMDGIMVIEWLKMRRDHDVFMGQGLANLFFDGAGTPVGLCKTDVSRKE